MIYDIYDQVDTNGLVRGVFEYPLVKTANYSHIYSIAQQFRISFTNSPNPPSLDPPLITYHPFHISASPLSVPLY